MNRNDFINLLEKSASIDPKLTSDIGEIVALFPYFQTAHLLLLKGLHDNTDIRFGNQLRQSAIHLADREILYHLLYTPEGSDGGTEEKIEPETSTDSNQTVIDSAKNSQEFINEIEKESLVTDTEINEISTDDAPVILIDQDDLPDEELISNSPAGGDPSDQTELLELDLEKNFIQEVTIKESDITTEEKLSPADLIDRFIISNPRIEPIREKKEGQFEDRSEADTAEGAFVTETLARIYIGQGYYSKAIDIFEKLSLKYPEKSSYFATQIEKVKDYIKK